tara:strand:+ start:537030 stop:538022 length:993 start_codon:yes stop_codon:yes gene_type:complete
LLTQRLATSAVLISIASLLIYLDSSVPFADVGGIWLLPLLGFFALGTAWDITTLLRRAGRLVSPRVAIAATTTVTFSAAIPMLWPLADSTYPPNCPIGRLGWIVVGSVTAIFGILIVEMYRYGRHVETELAAGIEKNVGLVDSRTIQRAMSSVFVSQYVGLPMALLVALRTMQEGNWGLWALLTTIAVTKSADAGAYFTGKAIGRHKLIPRLSPGKTIEGAIGGIVTATIVAFVCLSQLFQTGPDGAQVSTATASITALTNPLWGSILLGPLLAVAGMVGDLAESLVKRDSGAKDSGNLLPGLGGVWDVTDSLIAAILPAILCFAAGVGG